jgi:hypothetical protein
LIRAREPKTTVPRARLALFAEMAEDRLFVRPMAIKGCHPGFEPPDDLGDDLPGLLRLTVAELNEVLRYTPS